LQKKNRHKGLRLSTWEKYERMLQAQSMAIYVPSGMKGLKFELLAVAA
jgi:predicted component of type VI protein secretion system